MHEQPPKEKHIYCFLADFFTGFFFDAALGFLALVSGFFLVEVFLDLVTFLAEAFPVTVVFFLVADFFLVAAVFFLVVVVFFLAGSAFLVTFLGLGLTVRAFLASGDNLYDAFTLTRTPSVTALARADFITCFLISFCKYGINGVSCVSER